MLKKTAVLLAGMLLACTSCDPPDTPTDPPTDPSGALWNGTFSVNLYGGGTEKQYNIVMTGKDDIFYSLAYDSFLILTEEVSCSYNESGHLDPLIEGTPPIDYSNIGSGTYTKEYYDDSDADKPRRIVFNDDNSITVDLAENGSDWVTITSTLNGDSDTDTTGCLPDDTALYNMRFAEDEYEFPIADEQGRVGIRGETSFSYGSANMSVSFVYYQYDPEL